MRLADVNSVRAKEFHSRPLYLKRSRLLERVPHFWPTTFGCGPQYLQQLTSPNDLALMTSLKSFTVDRYQIESESKGEPRSLRFTFDFAPNDFIEDTKLIKDFEYRARDDGPGNLISKPVPIKWKGKK